MPNPSQVLAAVLALATSSVFDAAALRAQTPTGGEPPPPTIAATRVAAPPDIDGVLDDEAWAGVPIASGFVQRQPDPGVPATQATEARIVYDNDAIYVALRMHDDRADLIAAPLGRRDASGISSDWVYVMIDSYHDRRTGFVFGANPRGVQRDYMVYNDAEEDLSWDPVWEVATAVDGHGWTAEFQIPLGQLRFEPKGMATWGLNFQRRLARRDEWSFWSSWPPNASGYVSHFGMLTGIAHLAPARSVTLQPYVSARLARAAGDPRDPFHQPNDFATEAGADILVGLTGALTLSATLNPDFGQVEADPAEVNLTAFESFFSERRPFFVERADVFRFGQVRSNIGLNSKEFFYSRRIGRAPQRRIGGADIAFVDAPQESPILVAGKLTGRAGAWTIGLLDALTGETRASYVDSAGETFTTPVEPMTNYFAGRVRRDLRDGRSVVGAIVTATNRALGEGELGLLLGSGAYFAGIDFEHAWADQTWTLTGFAAASRVDGATAAIGRLQRVPSRYYTRPDAGHLRYDDARTHLSGSMATLALNRSGRWDLSLLYEEASPGVEINDLGFQGRVDFRNVAAFMGRRINETRGVFRSRNGYAYAASGWNFGGDHTLALLGAGTNASFTNLWGAAVDVQFRPAVMDDRLTRGGPVARSSPWLRTNASVQTDPRRRLSLQANGKLERTAEGTGASALIVTGDWRPTAAFRFRIGPEVSTTHSERQYVATIADAAADHTYSHRYVFADLDQTTVSITTRLDWTFTPRLSLELYAQPFISAGAFSTFKELAAPRSARFVTYGEDRGHLTSEDGDHTVDPDGIGEAPAFAIPNPDFNVRSLRGNSVLRWEFRPGSTLFFVWQQQRSGFDTYGDFSLERDGSEILAAPPTNVFVVKATYWLGH